MANPSHLAFQRYRKRGRCLQPYTAVGIIAFACLFPAGCSDKQLGSESIELHGAGATFPTPLYEKWFQQLTQEHPEVSIEYEEVGSGAGVQQFIDELVDFAASDDPLSDQQIAQVDRGVRQMPMTSGAIVIAYNLTDANGSPVKELRLSRKAYGGIFLGTIRNWRDEEIARHNPDVRLPDMPIQVEYRLDSSGTTAALTRHLSAIDQQWKEGPGIGKSIIWPVGAGMPGDRGVLRGLRQVPGSIGYLSFAFAADADVPMAILENRAGEFVRPTFDSIEAGFVGVDWADEASQLFIDDPPSKDAYPIVTYSWMLCYRVYEDAAKLETLRELLTYGLEDGQRFSQELGFVPLTSRIATKALSFVETISLPESADTVTTLRPTASGAAEGDSVNEPSRTLPKKETLRSRPATSSGQVAGANDDDVSVKQAEKEDNKPKLEQTTEPDP